MGNWKKITPVKLVVKYPDTIPCLPLENNVRHQLLMVTKEAVNNALKYANATIISLELCIDDKQIAWAVKDNGAGFDPGKMTDHGTHGNGLKNMCARMQYVKGWCHIDSQPGKGTEVRYGFMYGNSR